MGRLPAGNGKAPRRLPSRRRQRARRALAGPAAAGTVTDKASAVGPEPDCGFSLQPDFDRAALS